MFILQLALYAILLLFIFYLIAKVSNQYFIDSLDIITKKLNLSNDVAGATFMAIGSSAPEFFTAVIALTKVGAEQVGAGTIVGSAIFNVLVIVGASAVVAKAYLNWRPVVRDMGFYIISILVLLFTFRDGVISMYEGIVYIIFYAMYILILANWKKFLPKKNSKNFLEEIDDTLEEHEETVKERKGFFGMLIRAVDKFFDLTFPNLDKHPERYMLTFFLSIAYIAFFSWCLVEIAIISAHMLHISEAVIALTILAAGTSVPDLISSIIVAKKGRGGMAISNAIGSNTFDILIGLGLPWLGYILITGKQIVVSTENLISSILLLFFTVVALLFVIAVQKFKIGKSAGYFLIALYIMYIVYVVYQATHPGTPTLESFMPDIF